MTAEEALVRATGRDMVGELEPRHTADLAREAIALLRESHGWIEVAHLFRHSEHLLQRRDDCPTCILLRRNRRFLEG